MRSIRLAVLLGVLVWLVTFAAAIFAFPLRENERPLFESIMPVVLSSAVVAAAAYYITKLSQDFVREGLLLGAIWFVINIVIDLSLFMWGPMQMSVLEYTKDIGVTYLLIPVITTGFGYVAAKMAQAARWGKAR